MPIIGFLKYSCIQKMVANKGKRQIRRETVSIMKSNIFPSPNFDRKRSNQQRRARIQTRDPSVWNNFRRDSNCSNVELLTSESSRKKLKFIWFKKKWIKLPDETSRKDTSRMSTALVLSILREVPDKASNGIRIIHKRHTCTISTVMCKLQTKPTNSRYVYNKYLSGNKSYWVTNSLICHQERTDDGGSRALTLLVIVEITFWNKIFMYPTLHWTMDIQQ